MKGFIHCKERKSEEVPQEEKGLVHVLFPAHKWLCRQDAEIKHLTQNVGGGRRVFLKFTDFNGFHKGKSFTEKQQQSSEKSKSIYLPSRIPVCQNGRGDLLLLGTQSTLWIINPQGERAQEPLTSFLNVQEP